MRMSVTREGEKTKRYFVERTCFFLLFFKSSNHFVTPVATTHRTGSSPSVLKCYNKVLEIRMLKGSSSRPGVLKKMDSVQKGETCKCEIQGKGVVESKLK